MCVTGSQKVKEPKQVMFSDGIRPGGDLTDLDGSSEIRVSSRKSGRSSKKVERTGTNDMPLFFIQFDGNILFMCGSFFTRIPSHKYSSLMQALSSFI